MSGRSPFSQEFEAAHGALKAGGFASDWTKLVEKLVTLTNAGGPRDAEADALDEVRKHATTAGDAEKLGEDAGMLAAAGDYDLAKPADNTQMTAESRKRVAALKLLRHLYLLRSRGSHHVWVLALANGFSDWPTTALAGCNLNKMKALLLDTTEPFSEDDKRHLADASQEAMRWVQLALIALTEEAKPKEEPVRVELIKRWFGADTDVSTAAATLTAGFKKIQGVLNSGLLLLTDHPEVRHATTGIDAGFWQSEAFVKGAREAMDVIYVESAFFSPTNTLARLKNWARILVHELSHREIATKDKAYSWQGMKPGTATLSAADALINADSWAFFCADAAKQLSASDRTKALGA